MITPEEYEELSMTAIVRDKIKKGELRLEDIPDWQKQIILLECLGKHPTPFTGVSPYFGDDEPTEQEIRAGMYKVTCNNIPRTMAKIEVTSDYIERYLNKMERIWFPMSKK